jgi:hypothetical protein
MMEKARETLRTLDIRYTLELGAIELINIGIERPITSPRILLKAAIPREIETQKTNTSIVTFALSQKFDPRYWPDMICPIDASFKTSSSLFGILAI